MKSIGHGNDSIININMLGIENQTFKERIELEIYADNTSNRNAMGVINIAIWSKTRGAWAELHL